MNWSSVMWSAVAFAVFAAGIGIAWLMVLAGEAEQRQQACDQRSGGGQVSGSGAPIRAVLAHGPHEEVETPDAGGGSLVSAGAVERDTPRPPISPGVGDDPAT